MCPATRSERSSQCRVQKVVDVSFKHLGIDGGEVSAPAHEFVRAQAWSGHRDEPRHDSAGPQNGNFFVGTHAVEHLVTVIS